MNKIKPAFQIKLPLLAVAAGLLLSQTLASAATATFNVTPSTVSNNYPGTITLQIGGLTNGETVTVQKYLNLSGQGVITANDWLVEQFNLTDGQAGMVIGGVTNFNVPGDTDTFGGQITSVLNFQNGDFIQDIVGKYLYRLSSPVGHFPPVTNALLVTNYPFGQKLTGTVSNSASVVVPNAVVLLSGNGGGPKTGAVASSAGIYAISAPVGTYTPIAVGLGYVFDGNGTSASVALAAGKTVTANLAITNTTSHISGTVVDANNAGLGLPGVLVTAQGTGGLTSATFTDPNGNYSLGVLSSPAQWNVQPNNTAFLVDGYMSIENGVNAIAGATGVMLSVPKANALFYGTVLDNLGQPIQGVEVDAQDSAGLYQSRAFTDANGNYFAVALGLNNDAWQLQINTGSSSYIFVQPSFDQTGGANLAVGQALQVNLSALAANNTISGTLKDASGTPLAGIDIYANTITGTSYNQNAQTDASGNYSMNVANGTWQVGVSSCTDCGSGSLPNNYLQPQSQTVVIANGNATANFVAILAPYTISGTLKDNNGNPLAGVGVYAYTTTGTSYNQNTQTDANGNYSMGVINGTWQIAVQTCTECGGQGLPSNYLAPPYQTVAIANANVVVNLTATLAPYTISGSLKDGNGNPIAGIGVYEYATINSVNYNQNATTDASGNYSMAALNGTWTVGVNSGGGNNSLPNNYAQVQNQTVVVANANATANFVAQACGGVSITPALPDGQASVFYDQFLQASSCNNNFIWVFVSGNLPPGLTMNIFGSGEISGTTTNTGTYYFTVQVTDGNNLTATQPISLTIDSGSGTGQTGSLNVTINPQNIGAQWQVDGGALQSSGATVAGLSVGNHTISFSAVNGYTTPANQIVSVTANNTFTATGTYVAIVVQTGSLTVTLSPQNVGAKWQVDGGASQNSAATVAGLSVGNHMVTFSTVTGYTTPANQTVTITANTTATATGTYVLAGPTGSVEVTIAPAGAITAGAQWQVDGGTLQNSGTTVANLSVGSHTVSFSAINGWTAPVNQKVAIQSKVVSKATGTYVVIPTGSLQVTLVPPGAVAGSAQWQVDSGAFQNSGATVANLSVGNHTVNFKGINYWTAPVHQTVAIKAKIVTKATGTYAFDAQGIYNGLFAQPDTNVTTSGMLSGLAVTSSGAFSAKLLIAGSTNAVAGSFNAGGLANANVPRPAKQGGPLTLTMQVNWNAVPLTIGGTVSGVNGGAWTAGLTAELAATGLPSVAYTASLLPPGTPPGYGYFTITNHAGAVTLIGALADGTPISEAVPVSGLGDLPVYGNLYGSTGLLLGWLNLESGSPAGQLTWLKEASHSTVRYTNGFTNLLTVQGSRWTNPAPKMAAINLPAGFLDLAGGNLPAPLTFNVGVNNNNALVKLAAVPANLLTGSINPKTGLFTLNFNIGTGKATNLGTGVVLQNVTNAAGFFLGTNNAGSFILHP